MHAFRLLLYAAVLCAVAVHPSTGQTTFASLTGTITDPSGMVIAEAKIQATHVQSNYRYNTTSNEAGIYAFSQLREGDYELRITLAGFKEYVAKDIALVSLDARRMDVKLELGAVGTSVEVTDSGPALIETETPRVSDTREAATLKFMPTNSRNLTEFLPLTPGVLADTSGFRSLAGSKETQNDSTMDGVTLGNGESGGHTAIRICRRASAGWTARVPKPGVPDSTNSSKSSSARLCGWNSPARTFLTTRTGQIPALR